MVKSPHLKRIGTVSFHHVSTERERLKVKPGPVKHEHRLVFFFHQKARGVSPRLTSMNLWMFLWKFFCLDLWFAYLYPLSLRFNCRAWGNVACAVAWESADLAAKKKMTMLCACNWRTWKHSDGVSCQWCLEERKALVPCNEKLRPLEGMAQESLMRTEIGQMMDQLIPRRDIHTHTRVENMNKPVLQNWLRFVALPWMSFALWTCCFCMVCADGAKKWWKGCRRSFGRVVTLC